MSTGSDNTSLSYKDAGVDIDAGNALVERIKGVNDATLFRIIDGFPPRRFARPRCCCVGEYTAGRIVKGIKTFNHDEATSAVTAQAT